MPVFYKQDGSWKNVDSPYVKQNGQWVLPEQVYIKKNGQWKLIFEEFTFVVDTVGSSETQNYTKLEGQLSDFKDFGPDETFFFDQTLDEANGVKATAVDEERKLVATGGGDDTAYVYNNSFAVDRSNIGSPVSEISIVQPIQDPSEPIEGLGFYSDKNFAVAAEDLFVYDENFKLIQTFSTVEGNSYTDIKFNENDGRIAASTDGPYVYVYIRQQDGTYSFSQKLESPISGTAKSVSWRESDESIAVGTDAGEVYVFDYTYIPENAKLLDQHVGETKVEFSPSGRLAVVDENEVKVYSNGFNLTATLQESSEGTGGDVDWDDNDLLVHGSTDNRVYVYNGSDGSFDLLHTFDEASRKFESVSWDGQNEYIVGGTSESGSGDAHIFSTGVRMFFDWSEQGTGFLNRQRASGLRSLGAFETGLDSLDPNTNYEFRAGGYAAEQRTVIDDNSLTFTTVNLQADSKPVTNLDSTSATLNGRVTDFNRNTGNPYAKFKWGKDSQPLKNVANVGLVSSSAPVDFSVTIDNLDPGTDYAFKAASNYGGVVALGSKQTFKTKNVTADLTGVSDPEDFGDVFVTSSTASETSVVPFTMVETSGTGSYEIEQSQVNITGPNSSDFSVTTVGFPIEVPAGGSKDIDVEFDASADGFREGEISIGHDAVNNPNPFVFGLEGTGELVPNLAVQGSDNLLANADGTEDTTNIVIEETGGDYEATITSITEASSQPTGTEPSEWSISNLPGTLNSGNATVPAGGSVNFTVGWNPDQNTDQNYNIDIDYKGSGISDNTVLQVTINGIIENQTSISIDAERDGTTETSYAFADTFEDETSGISSLERTFRQNTNSLPVSSYVKDSSRGTTTVGFAAVGDPSGDYQVTELDITGGSNPGDFAIKNAPSEVTDNDSTTSVNVSDGNNLTFDIEFNPSALNSRDSNLEVTANNANNSPFKVSLSGIGIQSSEIATDVSDLSFGRAITGGNVSGEEAVESVTVSNLSDDETFTVENDGIVGNDYNITTSIAGTTIGPNAVADIEFVPNGDYSDGAVVEDIYEISHDAIYGLDPTTVELSGTVQVTSLIYRTADDQIQFDPTTSGPDFAVFGNPDGNVQSRDFEIYVPNSGNDVSTDVSITDSTSDTSVLSLDSSKNQVLSPGGSLLTATMNYDPGSLSDDGVTEEIEVKWDNSNKSQKILVEGVTSSTIDVKTIDSGTGATAPDDNDDTLDFGTVTANESETLSITVSEQAGAENFDITTAGSLNDTSDPYAIDSTFGTVPVTVSNGSPVSADIKFAPPESDAGSTINNIFTFEHDAVYVPATYEESPVQIALTADVLEPVSVNMVQDSDGTVPVNYEADVGATDRTTIRISETGGDNDVTINSFTVTDSGDASNPFSLNSNNSTDYSNYNSTISAGTDATEKVVSFSPNSNTGSTPNFIVNGTLEVDFSGPGVPNNSTTTVGLEGEVIRPAKADISDSTSTPVDFGSYTVSSTGSIDDSKTYTIVEENLKNSYDITGISVTGTNSSNFSNDTSATDSISSGNTVSAGGSLTGTARFQYDASSESGGTKTAVIELSHDAPEEGSDDTGSTSGRLDVTLYAEVTEN